MEWAKEDKWIEQFTPGAELFFNDTLIWEYTLRYGAEIRADDDERAIHAHTPGKDIKTFFLCLS